MSKSNYNKQDADMHITKGLPSEGGQSNTSVLLDVIVELITTLKGHVGLGTRKLILELMPEWDETNIDWMIYVLIKDGTLERSVLSDKLYNQMEAEMEQEGEEDTTDLSAFHMACLRVWHSEHYEYEERPIHMRELVKYLDPKYKITYGMMMRYCGYECTER